MTNVLQVRSVCDEYLVAMKLMAGRQYKNDLSDIVGILIEQEEGGNALTLEKIKDAADALYGSYSRLPDHSREFIESIFAKKDLRKFYRQCRNLEKENKDILLNFQEDYPGVLNEDNLAEVLNAAKEKKHEKS